MLRKNNFRLKLGFCQNVMIQNIFHEFKLLMIGFEVFSILQ